MECYGTTWGYEIHNRPSDELLLETAKNLIGTKHLVNHGNSTLFVEILSIESTRSWISLEAKYCFNVMFNVKEV